MYQLYFRKPAINNIITIASFLLLILLLPSCGREKTIDNEKIKRQFKTVDSLFIASKRDSAFRLLNSLKSLIPDNSPNIATFYCMKAGYVDGGTVDTTNAEQINLYADSALAFFEKDQSRIKQYPNEYFQTMLVKGDAGIRSQKYISALNYYFKAKKALTSEGSCDNGDLSSKMAYIFFSQKKYELAAKYWVESNSKLATCHDRYSKQKIFFKQQGALNNAGYSFFKAGRYDTANYYFTEDLKLTAQADSDHLVNKSYINGARVVVYDNLAGLSIVKGDLPSAQKYLDQSLSIPTANIDGMKIPPFIKLAKVSMLTGNNKKAEDAFYQSRLLLNRFYKANPESNIEWNRLYAQYLLKLKRSVEAYRYQDAYIRLRDSVFNNSSSLYQLDVDRELNSLSQKQSLIDLQQRNHIKKVYLFGISVIVFLAIVIMILIARNLKKSQLSHKSATQQNEELRATLDELARVNQNYIRIMRVMAHDLRNPLSGMTGLATVLLSEDDLSDDNRQMIKLIETTGIYSMEMIAELLKSGLAEDDGVLKKHVLDIKALLYDSVELLQFKAKEKSQTIVFDSGDKPIMANINHEKIWRVFNNLIVNAIKFSHDGGIINVGIKQQKDTVLISIADNGIGIPESEKESIFEMFTSAKKFGTNGEQPFGLGLSISKRIVEKHQGRIWFESNPGEGTTFYLELPAT
ncbi:tetratricopeptide repeat-containing sensor histidine kinase [Mucilaginibacter agri]|uniref:histidine kinase n=1 Tax=Mucilaginibacter agri TaxID=2695265 RepID=A0A965ZIX8_9SPHI|nr:HAMP domain-containing sensor histidine kinase [Mucilaginibacter agri]NCD71940.1 hypothetical protein [Mucilaginibacter agri]